MGKTNSEQGTLPVQPVDQPIICNPYDEPDDHWLYDGETGEASRGGHRRPAGYWYKDEDAKVAAGQRRLFLEEQRDLLTLVNLLREDVKRWRDRGYRGASQVTQALLRHWASEDLPRRLFFCQKEAVETIIYLAELRMPGKQSRTGFRNFELLQADLEKMLRGERPSPELAIADYFPTLLDKPADTSLLPLRRLGCKMATGSGKTVVMAMLITWAFCNRGVNPASKEYPNAVLVCCPNLTIKERLQVLRPENPENYYDAFDLVPTKYRPLLQGGKVLVENWHRFLPESEHKEGASTYAVVDKGPETPETFARRILGDLYDRMPIMVLNDEGHHCWRPAPVDEKLSKEERDEAEEATVWVGGLDRLNNAHPTAGEPGIGLCVDLSATPFYIKGSGYPEGRPFPWIVNDFGLVDAIECGIVKIPRLPVLDTTGRPDPKYFKLWAAIGEELDPADRLPGGKPKPDVVYTKAEPALLQIAGQWVERYEYIQEAKPGQDATPPVLIIVCDNTDIAEVFYRNISGESEEEVVTEDDLDEDGQPRKKRKSKSKGQKRTVYGPGRVFPHFANTATEKRTIRIDTKLLAQAESEDPSKSRQAAAEALRRVVATVGKPGQPGEQVRCVVAVAMLNEGWDAHNVTQVLGIRAFGTELLREQVVGRGLRRMDYDPDPETGMLTEEYVDVYGIPFSVIPFRGRPTKAKATEDKPKNHVRAVPERVIMRMRFPVVEGYVFALRHNLVKCDIDAVEPLVLEPQYEPTATFVIPTVGYREGHAAGYASPGEFVEHNREAYYRQYHVQAIQFVIAKLIVDRLISAQDAGGKEVTDRKRRVLKLQSRHQLFPRVYPYVVQYVDRKVDFQGCHPCELGLRRYVDRIVSRLVDAIEPDDAGGEPPLLPVLNRYKAIGSTDSVDFKTTRPCRPSPHSHINQVVADTARWEEIAVLRLEQACQSGAAKFYARNDHLGLFVPYEYDGVHHNYQPDFLVRLASDVTLLLEMKGWESDQDRAKHTAARRWVSAVNNWGQLGEWDFHVCRNPQLLDKELGRLAGGTAG